MEKIIIGKTDENICKTFNVHSTTHLVPERKIIWSKPYTASKRQIWTRTENSMKAETFISFASYNKDLNTVDAQKIFAE